MGQQRALVIGLGMSGKATATYLLEKGYEVVAVDASHEREKIWGQNRVGLRIEADSAPQDLLSYSCVIVSPGISPKHPLYKKALELQVPIFSEAELILRAIQQRCIGITGTNGKTTMTLFIEHLLKEASVPAKAIGNVGYPFTQYALEHKDRAEVLVCELSSYHLETLSAQALDIGVLLEITPDHLDRYQFFDAYAQVKLNMVSCIKQTGVLFVHHKVFSRFKKELELCKGRVVVIPELFSNSCKDSYLQLTKNREYCDFLDLIKEKTFSLEILYLGKAIAKELSISDEDLARAIRSFVKPPHRLEYVATVRDVRFINDSKATNIESVIHAVNTLGEGIVLIAGGKDKDLEFEEWKKYFGSRVTKVFVIGECAHKIQKALQEAYEIQVCKDLKQATHEAFAYARPQDIVLLSPGCASFDSYRNYMHRGESFREIVTALNEECSR